LKKFLQNVGELLPDNGAPQPRRWYSSLATVRTSNPTKARHSREQELYAGTVPPTENSTGSLFLCYISFCTISPIFLPSPTSHDVSRPMFNATYHKEHTQMVNFNHLLYTTNHTSHIHTKILSILTKQTRYTEKKKGCLLFMQHVGA
jgi:hypothetical protein